METITRNVRDLGTADRLVLEQVLGQPLAENQQIVVNVVNLEALAPPSGLGSAVPVEDIPAWWKVYEGLNDAEVDRLDQAIRNRANLTRTFE
jgi:hypothetical protein